VATKKLMDINYVSLYKIIFLWAFLVQFLF
jgi:hypothetical protein